MKIKRFFALLVVSLFLILIGCRQTPPTENNLDPAKPDGMLRAFFEAIRAGDLQTAQTYLSDDTFYDNVINRNLAEEYLAVIQAIHKKSQVLVESSKQEDNTYLVNFQFLAFSPDQVQKETSDKIADLTLQLEALADEYPNHTNSKYRDQYNEISKEIFAEQARLFAKKTPTHKADFLIRVVKLENRLVLDINDSGTKSFLDALYIYA